MFTYSHKAIIKRLLISCINITHILCGHVFWYNFIHTNMNHVVHWVSTNDLSFLKGFHFNFYFNLYVCGVPEYTHTHIHTACECSVHQVLKRANDSLEAELEGTMTIRCGCLGLNLLPQKA